MVRSTTGHGLRRPGAGDDFVHRDDLARREVLVERAYLASNSRRDFARTQARADEEHLPGRRRTLTKRYVERRRWRLEQVVVLRRPRDADGHRTCQTCIEVADLLPLMLQRVLRHLALLRYADRTPPWRGLRGPAMS